MLDNYDSSDLSYLSEEQDFAVGPSSDESFSETSTVTPITDIGEPAFTFMIKKSFSALFAYCLSDLFLIINFLY